MFIALLATLYLVALRISWDLLRNQLALAFLFVTLTLLQKEGDKQKHLVLASLTMSLVVLTNQIVAVVSLTIAVALTVHASLKKRNEGNMWLNTSFHTSRFDVHSRPLR